jgi:AraC-like DNA-binding protein
MNPYKWDTTPYKWVINVHEPWWRTSVMIVLYVFILLLLMGVNTYFYLKNTNMKAMRNSGQVNVLKRIVNFSERCSLKGHELLEPISEEVVGDEILQQNELTPEFIDMMIRIMPTVQNTNAKQLSMRLLSEKAGLEVQAFYSLVTSNIYKSPRPLAIKMMLDHAVKLMQTTNKSIEEISNECGFVSPNYFIALFYRVHKITPKEFRAQR